MLSNEMLVFIARECEYVLLIDENEHALISEKVEFEYNDEERIVSNKNLIKITNETPADFYIKRLEVINSEDIPTFVYRQENVIPEGGSMTFDKGKIELRTT
jgi:hypothetical protein